MKTIKLISIEYHNFKGIKDFKLTPDGESISVSGANATGKTTLFDGFTWLLFGKNSDEVKKFNPKPLGPDGAEQLGLDPEVSAVLEVDGQRVELRRKSAEKWSTPRGQAEKVRKADATELTIDDVPQKVKDFTAYISSIVDEDSFKMITNPFAFSNLKWTDRRQLLMDLVDDVSDDEVVKATKNPDELAKLLDQHSAKDMKQIIAGRRRKLKAEIDGLPARIDEATRAIPAVPSSSKTALDTKLDGLKKTMGEAQQSLSLASTGNMNLDAHAEKARLQGEYGDAQMSYMQGNQLELNGLSDDMNTMQRKLNTARMTVDSAKISLSQAKTALEVATAKHDELTKRYVVLNNKNFDESQLTCPTCGQELQPDKQDNIRKHFNVEKSTKLEEIKADGIQSAEDMDMANSEIASQQQALEAAQAELDQVQTRLDKISNDYNQAKASQVDFGQTTKGENLQKQIDKQQQLIETNSGDNSKAKSVAQARVDEVQADIDQVKTQLASFNQIKQQEDRVKALHAQEDELKDTYASLDKQSYLLDQYTRTRVTMLEGRINKLFKLVNFKLFEVQKNGEINEICEAMVDGVPYSTDLNNAAKINAGLDIINTLSTRYQVIAPIFVDNAESVNRLIDTDAQQIALVVSDEKQLTVAQETEKEVA
ncbi:AAA family ATPase [Lactiplantibacillus brownii]|uniref:AAA family ATPase n=1 Tax=Lactiplantibacillus brownii TaxID=3069269 RepID=UPI0038B29067